MKIRTHLKAAALFAAMFATTTLSAQDTVIRSNELPKNAQQHLRKAFGSQRIVQAEKETTREFWSKKLRKKIAVTKLT